LGVAVGVLVVAEGALAISEIKRTSVCGSVKAVLGIAAVGSTGVVTVVGCIIILSKIGTVCALVLKERLVIGLKQVVSVVMAVCWVRYAWSGEISAGTAVKRFALVFFRAEIVIVLGIFVAPLRIPKSIPAARAVPNSLKIVLNRSGNR